MDPFDLTDKYKEAAKLPLGPNATLEGNKLPVNFLTDLDSTGGNSGSPTLNAKGELVGLLFDGDTEGLGNDWVWNGDRGRSIHVDTRYMLWVMEAVDGAQNLIKEMKAP